MKKYSFLAVVGLVSLFMFSCKSSGPSEEEQEKIASNCIEADLAKLDVLVYEEMPAVLDNVNGLAEAKIQSLQDEIAAIQANPQSVADAKMAELNAQKDELIKLLEGSRAANALTNDQVRQLDEMLDQLKSMEQ